MQEIAPAGVLDYSSRWPNLNALGAFNGYGWPANAVGNFREHLAAYAAQLTTISPFIQYGTNLSISNLNGADGLRPQPKINHHALGITEEETEDLAEAFEHIWQEWASSPFSDRALQAPFGVQTATAVRRAYDSGEALLSIDWTPRLGSRFGTTVHYVEPQRIARAGVIQQPPGSPNQILQGVETDPNGQIVALYLMPRMPQPGHQHAVIYNPAGKRHDAVTPWGRPLLKLSVLDRRAPNVNRGISPIASAIVRAFQLDQLTDLNLQQQAAQLAVAWALTTDLSPQEASGAIISAEERQERFLARLDEIETTLKTNPVKLPDGGKLSVLPTGSKLEAVKASAPTQGYDIFNKRLLTELARAFAISYSELTGDFSQDSFSSAKMSGEGPWSIVYRRRAEFLAPLYQTAYEAVIEEAVAKGYVELPGDVSFYGDRAALLNCAWIGPTKPIIDPAKEASANDVELSNGSTSLAQIARERGTDWRDTIDQRSRELAYAKRKGVDINPAKNSKIEPDGDEPKKPKKGASDDE